MEYLVKRAQKKDDQAFVQLIEMVKGDLYKIARSYLDSEADIADAIQDTIIVCYEKIDSLKERKYFKTWLIRILINKCNDILRKGKRECSYDVISEQGDAGMSTARYEFEELMNQLDEKYRTVLILYYAEGFKIREIAQLLEMEENTVKTRLSRGRKEVKKMYTMELAQGRR